MISVGVVGGLLLVPVTGGGAAAGTATARGATTGVALTGAVTTGAVAAGTLATGTLATGAFEAGAAGAGTAAKGLLVGGSAAAHGGSSVTSRLPAANSDERPVLRRGSRGHWVEVAQRKLDVSADGIFGPVTESAVIEFQREQDLLVDGIVGPQTWGALDGDSSGSSGGDDGGGTASGASKAASYARAQVGDSYSWGGDGPNAFDCSGLTMRAWKQGGVQLPHSSQAQAKRGTKVSWSGVRPGDLMFFYDPISHVGIYVGDGEMVAASNPEDGVELVEIRSSYWRSNFATARRL